MPRRGPLLFVLALVAAPASAQDPASARAALVSRAKALELPTPYVAPPGDPLSHHAAGYAKVVCSAVFVSGFEPDFAARNLGFFVAPLDARARLGKPVVDRATLEVKVALPNGVTREARFLGDQGCVALPQGQHSLYYAPKPIAKRAPAPRRTPWPMGDSPSLEPLPAGLDPAALRRATEAAFEPEGAMTAAFVVTWKGRIVAERYGPGIAATTPLESWSMGKSVVATLLGVLIRQGAYTLDQKAPIPEWQSPGDPRAAIRIADILRMSSGLRIRAPGDPDFDPQDGYPDHLYLYTGGVDSFHYAATRPQQWPPNTVGRYRNTDPVLGSYLVRLAAAKRGEDYQSFPQRALFDKLGIRTMVLEADPYGNFLTQGYELASARDWARLGNLYLQDGVWNGERLLPEGFVEFVTSVAPAWQADERPVYGGFFWINGDGGLPVPREAYFMAGAGGQTTLVIPSHDLVVVRLGHYRGSDQGEKALARALTLLMQAVPRRE